MKTKKISIYDFWLKSKITYHAQYKSNKDERISKISSSGSHN